MQAEFYMPDEQGLEVWIRNSILGDILYVTCSNTFKAQYICDALNYYLQVFKA